MNALARSSAQSTNRLSRSQADAGSRVSVALLLCALFTAVISFAALAQSSSASYQIPRQSTDAGAGRSNSASYALNGSIGQPDAGLAMSSASYTLRGGFQRAVAIDLTEDIFSNGFEN